MIYSCCISVVTLLYLYITMFPLVKILLLRATGCCNSARNLYFIFTLLDYTDFMIGSHIVKDV